MASADNVPVQLFVKCQRGHLTRGIGPLFRQPTARREFENLQRLAHAGIAVPECVFYGEERSGGEAKAILVTVGLAGRVPLDQLLEAFRGCPPTAAARRALVRSVATSVRRIHDLKVRHGSLYPKHIFVDAKDLGAPPAFIDLEKMRRTPFDRRGRLMDYDALNRRSSWFTRADRLRFLKASLKPGEPLRAWWETLVARYHRKGGKGTAPG